MSKPYFAKAFLRRPGQSNQIGIGWGTLGLGFFSGVIVLSICAGLVVETRYLQAVFSVAAVFSLAGAYASWRFAYRYMQGLEGEKRVYDELVPAIRAGYHVLSSFPGQKFDVDFVVLGPAGVFAVEVKNPTKYSKDDRVVVKNGIPFLISPERRKPKALSYWNPIKQVRENVRWIERNLSGSIKGKSLPIKGVVAFPDMMVEEHIEHDLLVLNPASFVMNHLPRLPKVLEPHEVGTLLRVLRDHVRANEVAAVADL